MQTFVARPGPLVRAVLIVALLLGVILLLRVLLDLVNAVGSVLAVFFVAWVLGFILRPAARRVASAFRLSWPLAVVALYVALAALVALLAWLLLPTAIVQGLAFAQQLDQAAQNLPKVVATAQVWLNHRGIPLDFAASLSPASLSAQARSGVEGLAGLLFGGVAATLGMIGSAILAAVLSFFFVLNGDTMMAAFLALVPTPQQSAVRFVFSRVNQILGAYIRGYLLIMVFYGVGTGVIMVLAHLPYALLFGLLAGLLMIVPVVGGLVAMAPPLILAVASGSTATLVITALLLVVLQGVTFYALEPRVLGRAISFGPLWFFFVLMVGAKLAGLLGAIFGLPIAAILYALARAVYERKVLHREVVANEEASLGRAA